MLPWTIAVLELDCTFPFHDVSSKHGSEAEI